MSKPPIRVSLPTASLPLLSILTEPSSKTPSPDITAVRWHVAPEDADLTLDIKASQKPVEKEKYTSAYLFEETKAPSKNHKATIGIIGLSPLRVAKLNKFLIKCGNQDHGFKNDQDFPEIIAIGIAQKTSRTEIAKKHLPSQFAYCDDFGCDVVAVTESLEDFEDSKSKNQGFFKDSKVKETLTPRKDENLENDEGLEKFAKRIMAATLAVKEPRRPDLYFNAEKYASEETRKTEEERIIANLKKDQEEREARMQQRMLQGGYEFLRNTKYVAVCGGAGPAASVDSAIDLAETATPCIHYNQVSAPGKYIAEMRQGFSYVPHYEMMVALFDIKGIEAECFIFPCNTIHIRLEEFAKKVLDKVIDLPTAVLEFLLIHYHPTEGNPLTAIVIGTPITTGIGAEAVIPEGLYEQYRKRGGKPETKAAEKDKYKNIKFVFPKPEEQREISDTERGAIFLLKQGQFRECEEISMRVGKNIRARMKSEGDPREAEDIIIILACTELPAAIGRKMGFIKNGMINPGYLAVEIAQKRIQEASQKTPTTPTTPSSTSPAERKKAVNLFRAATEQLREKERVTGSDSDDSDLGTPQGHTGTIDEKQGKEIAGFKVFVFIDSKGDYRITARGGEDSERAVWLTKVLDEIYEGIKARNPEDRLNRKKDYIVFHNPNPEGEFPEGTLLKQLKGWLRKNELEGEKIQKGSPRRQKEKQQSASPTTETKTGKSMVASQSIVATPAATVTLTAFSRIEPPQRTRTV